MRIGTLEINIDPVFPVKRMFSEEKHLKVSDELNCRIVVFEYEGKRPFYHISIDTVELYWDYRNRIKAGIEEKLKCGIELVTSATHSHFCPCLTTDEEYQNFLYYKIISNIQNVRYIEVKELTYRYQYNFFDKTGKSRISHQESPYVFAETLSFYKENKRLITFLVYNSHATTMHMHQGDFTSEYIGKCISSLKKHYPEEFFTFMLGPAGDISSRFTRLSQDYEEIQRLSNLLTNEYIKQLETEEPLKPVDRFEYHEIDFPIGRAPVNLKDFEMPKDITPREKQAIEEISNAGPHMEININLKPKSHRFCHWIIAEGYSVIFEPFETFSSYYRYVVKEKCSLITISNGFDNYITGLEPQRITMELFADTVTRDTKENMARLFQSWSNQEDAVTPLPSENRG